MITEENAAKRLLSHRADNGITQEELSKKTGVTSQTLRNIEKGLKKPQSLTIFKLNKYFTSFEK